MIFAINQRMLIPPAFDRRSREKRLRQKSLEEGKKTQIGL
jgi:hypothetical protein